MPHSIILSNLSWSTPDGRPLFSDINLSLGAERAGLVGRNGVGKTTLATLIAGELLPLSGTISVSGRVHVLRQSLQVEPDETVADLFNARYALQQLERAQAGEATLEELSDIDWTLDADIHAALASMELSVPLSTQLSQLSGGQRTRVALAAQIHATPDFLILDEPTNNLDREGRQSVCAFLRGWRGGALVISHDRELLEEMDSIVEITSLGITRYGGNWSQYRERKVLELAAAEHDLVDAGKRLAEIDRKARVSEERQARRDHSGRTKAARGDMPRIVAGGLKMRAEQSSGASVVLSQRMKGEALSDVAAARQRIEILQPLAVALTPTGLPASRTVLRLDRVTAGFDPAMVVLRDISFDITGPERIAITGPNGSGKTTLLSVITGALAPLSGSVDLAVRSAFLDQHVDLLDRTLSIRDNFLRLNPRSGENECRAALARLMFRADAALQPVGTLSGGQMLRAGLACVTGGSQPPQLLILDEPTNHLDLDSIAAVEAGLRGYDGALLVVSHDEAFLSAIGITRRIRLNQSRMVE